MDSDDLDKSIADRKYRREKQLPKRYRDVPPHPPASLPPSSQSAPKPPDHEALAPTPQELPPEATSQGPSSILARVAKVLKSTRNIFGLFRQYHATRFPEHDPDGDLTLN